MTYIKINDTRYPATIAGKVHDAAWDNRASKEITLAMTYEEASALFIDGLAWAIVAEQEMPTFDENGVQTGTEMQEMVYDNSEYCLAGDITVHRDGTVTVKMGCLTELEEAYEIMLGGI